MNEQCRLGPSNATAAESASYAHTNAQTNEPRAKQVEGCATGELLRHKQTNTQSVAYPKAAAAQC